MLVRTLNGSGGGSVDFLDYTVNVLRKSVSYNSWTNTNISASDVAYIVIQYDTRQDYQTIATIENGTITHKETNSSDIKIENGYIYFLETITSGTGNFNIAYFSES